MPRPRRKHNLSASPRAYYFKPQGVPMKSLKTVTLLAEEIEALKLYHVDRNDQISAAEKLGVSQPTFSRILNNAYSKISQAIIHGYAIELQQTIV